MNMIIPFIALFFTARLLKRNQQFVTIVIASSFWIWKSLFLILNMFYQKFPTNMIDFNGEKKKEKNNMIKLDLCFILGAPQQCN